MAERYSYSDLKELAILMMYELLARDISDNVTIAQLKDFLGERASLNLLRNALLDIYEGDEFVYFGKGAEDETDWRINRNGIKYAERLAKASPNLKRQVNALLGDNTPEEGVSENEQSDDWEPLPLERAGPEYDNAVDMTETALSEISGNNGYAESESEERDRIVWSIGEGLKQIKDGLPSRNQVISMLVKPLKYISDKFAGASMGEIAKAAIKALMTWLGLG